MNLMCVKNNFCLLLAGVDCIRAVKTNKVKFYYSEVFLFNISVSSFLLNLQVVFKIIEYIYFSSIIVYLFCIFMYVICFGCLNYG